jgi:hypothetical protein
MKQSRAASLFESLVNIVVGFGLSILCQAFILPALGVAIPWRANFLFAVAMTAVSIARQFTLRRVFEALHIRRPLSPFMQAVIAERFRQVEAEGWSIEHDDQHALGELAIAGACYADHAADPIMPRVPLRWPWSNGWWKPQGLRRDLVRGAALIIAEGEKFDRNRKPKPKRLVQGGYQPSGGPRPKSPVTTSGVQASPVRETVSKFEKFGT